MNGWKWREVAILALGVVALAGLVWVGAGAPWPGAR